jgi:hypothetical protein
LPDEHAVDVVVDALAEVLRRAAVTWKESAAEGEEKKVGKGEPLPDESASEFAARQKAAATKSGAAKARRDGSGRRIDKPFGSAAITAALKREADEDPAEARRDSSGRRKKKPYDPRNFGQGGL